MGKLKEFTQDELNYFLTLPNVITSSKYSKMDIFGKDLGGFIVLKFISTSKEFNIPYPSFLCKCRCGCLFLREARAVVEGRVFSCGKCNEQIIKFLSQFKSLKDLSQEDLKWLLKIPVYFVKVSKYQEVEIGTKIQNIKIIKYLPSLGTNWGPQFICECLVCHKLFLAPAHLVMNGSYKTCGSMVCLRKVGLYKGRPFKELKYFDKNKYPILEKIGKEGFETLTNFDEELLIREDKKCKQKNRNNLVYKELKSLKKTNSGVYGCVIAECRICHKLKDIRLKDWLSKNAIVCDACGDIKCDKVNSTTYKYRDFISNRYVYEGKGVYSKGIQYIWIRCKECGKLLEVNGEDYLNNKIFKNCMCFDKMQDLSYEVKQDIFIEKEGYIKYNESMKGTIIGTDKIIDTGPKKYTLLVECLKCGLVRVVDEEEFLNERTFNFNTCQCEKRKLTQLKLGDRRGHLRIIGFENNDVLVECDCGKKGHIEYKRFIERTYKYCSKECHVLKFSSKYTDTSFIGKEFNNFKVLSILQRDTFMNEKLMQGVYWKCECKICGRTGVFYAQDIVKGIKKSCCDADKYTVRYSNGDVINGIKIVNIYSIPGQGTLWQCICPICGDLFIRDPNSIVTGHCTSCGCINQSLGESVINEYLMRLSKEYNFTYSKEKTFPDLVSKKGSLLRYDFCIYFKDKTLLIEYDGEQHHDFTKIKGVSNQNIEKAKELFAGIQERDKQKDDYAYKHGYPLIRIDYTKNISKIHTCIDKFLKREGVM